MSTIFFRLSTLSLVLLSGTACPSPVQAQAADPTPNISYVPSLIPTSRFYAPPGAFSTTSDPVPAIKNQGGRTDIALAPSGRPAAVQFEGHTIFFLPRFNDESTYVFPVSVRHTITSYVRPFACSPIPGAVFGSNIANFPYKGSDNSRYVPNEREVDAKSDHPVLVAAATFKDKIWVAMGGPVGGQFYNPSKPSQTTFDVYLYTPDRKSLNFPFDGKYEKIDNFTFERELSSVSATTVSHLESVSDGKGGQKVTATSILNFFASDRKDASQAIKVYPTQDGYISTHLGDMKVMPGNPKLGADIHATTTVDSEGTPIAALAWSVTTNYSTQQYAMGMTFFDGKNFVGNATTLMGPGGGGNVPIPQAIRVAVGNVAGSVPANRLQVFGNLNGKLGRWEYQITGTGGAGRWTNSDVSRPYLVDPKNTLELGGDYPDFFTVVNIEDTVPHVDQGFPSKTLDYYQNTIAVMSWKTLFDDHLRASRGHLNTYFYDSDQMIPYGVHDPAKPELKPWYRSRERAMNDLSFADTWILLGAFHGVPPSLIALNEEGAFTGTGGSLSYGDEKTEKVGWSNSYGTSYSVGYKGSPIPKVLDLEITFKSELNKSYAGSSSATPSFTTPASTLRQYPNDGYLLFEVPTVQAMIYRRSGPNQTPIVLSTSAQGEPLYSDIFVGRTVNAAVELLPYNLVNPSLSVKDSGGPIESQLYSKGMAARPATNDLNGWHSNFVDRNGVPNAYGPPPNSSGLNPLKVRAGAETQNTALTWDSSTSGKQETTTSMEIKASLWGFGGSLGSKTTNSVTVETTSKTKINTLLNYPVKMGDVAGYSATPYFFRSTTVANCDFVPSLYRTNQTYCPFLFTYHVDFDALGTSAGPTLMTDLASKSVYLGASTYFQVIATSDSAITYKWFHNGALIPGQTTNVLILRSVTDSAKGNYSVEATDRHGTTSSPTVSLAVLGAPDFPNVLTNQTVAPGERVVLRARAIGQKPILYQWYLNGAPVTGATADTFVVTPDKIKADGVSVKVIATNALGTDVEEAVVNSDLNAPIDPGNHLFAGSGYWPAKFRNVSTGGAPINTVVLQGQSVTARAEHGTYTRIAFVDTTGKPMYAEFKGAGLVTVSIANGSTYTLDGVSYTRGLANIIVTDSDASTFLKVYTPAPQPTPYPSARLCQLRITSNEIGKIDVSDILFTASGGDIGILAPHLQDSGPILFGAMNAVGDAIPNLILGSGINQNFDVTVKGNLTQNNGRSILTEGVSHVGLPASNATPVVHFFDLSAGLDVTKELIQGPIQSK